jgi:predicted HAD superfamily Cof-like phosphohydrolase
MSKQNLQRDVARECVDMFSDVLDFHKKFGSHVEPKPWSPTKETRELRHSLIDEEVNQELLPALRSANNLPAIADALADSIYVILGTAISFGIDLRPIWKAVHETNMAKEGGATREDGKILKPEGWQAPDIFNLILAQQGCG